MSKNSNKLHPLIKIKNILLEDINYRLYKIEMEQKKISNEFGKIDDKFIKGAIQFELDKRQYITKKELKKYIMIFLAFIIIINIFLFIFFDYKLNGVKKKGNFNNNNNKEAIFESEIDNIYNFLLDKKLPIIKNRNSILINSNSIEEILYIFLWSYKFRNDYSFLELKPIEAYFINKDNFRVISEFYPILLQKLNKESNGEVVFYFEGAYDIFPIFLDDILNKIMNCDILIHYKKIEFPYIYFEKSSFVLLDREIEKLNKVIFYMNNIPSLSLKIIGHADKTGEDRLNIDLSCKRAIEVEKFLIKNGISANRLKVECFSSFRANSDNPVENRKVEFKFLF